MAEERKKPESWEDLDEYCQELVRKADDTAYEIGRKSFLASRAGDIVPKVMIKDYEKYMGEEIRSLALELSRMVRELSDKCLVDSELQAKLNQLLACDPASYGCIDASVKGVKDVLFPFRREYIEPLPPTLIDIMRRQKKAKFAPGF